MRPILLNAHERALTQVKYNRDGDILVTCSKDHIVNVWYSHNGERIGTYTGHSGAVWTADINASTTLVVTGAADNEMRLWSADNGKCVKIWKFLTAIKRVAFSEDGNRVLAITEERSGQKGKVWVYEINQDNITDQKDQAVLDFTPDPSQSKPTVAGWGPADQTIITGHENGRVACFSFKTGEELMTEKIHSGAITDLQFALDKTYFVTSSKDQSAKLVVTKDLQVLKTYATETPLNSAAITPLKPYVVVGGGQEAMNVTTTSARQGKFETRFWHKIFEEEVGRVKGHFGPINTVAVNPDGKSFASGAEDGYVRLHHFDPDYFRTQVHGMEPVNL